MANYKIKCTVCHMFKDKPHNAFVRNFVCPGCKIDRVTGNVNTWQDGPLTTEPYIGFVYRIVERSTGKTYIGCKQFWEIYKKAPTKYLMKNGKFVKDDQGKRVINTRVNKIHVRNESDWKTYNTSNRELREKLKESPSNYRKQILFCCKDLTELKAREAYIQLEYYFKGEWDLLYNEIINLRLRIRKSKQGDL